MKKSFSKLFLLHVILFCFVVFTKCIKLDREMKVSMGEVTSLSTNSAVISVEVIDLGEGTFKACGLCWSTALNPTLSNDKTTVGTGKGNFTNNLSGLSAGTKYYVRPYLTTSVGTLIGEGIAITTKDFPAVISTDPVNNANNVVLNKVITASFSQPMNPSTIAISTFTLNQGATAVIGMVTYSGTTATFTPSNTLIAGTTYTATITTGAKNSDGVSLTNNYIWIFTTNPVVIAPTLTTTTVTSITSTTAVSGGNITSGGGGIITARGVCWATTTNPTTSNFITTDGTGPGSFTSNLTGLLPATTYYIRSYATNSAGTAYGTNELNFRTADPVSITDIDGNQYNIIRIGTQLWMKENLKTTRYNDGTSIRNETDNAIWAGLRSPAYCWYNNDDVTYKATYGALYNWYVVDATSNGGKNVCPTGWHVPSNLEWNTLEAYLSNNGYGYQGVSSDIAKSIAAKSGWSPGSSAGTPGNDQVSNNTSGFTALPGGIRHSDGLFNFKEINTQIWSKTEYDSDNGLNFLLEYNFKNTFRPGNLKWMGQSIRCVKD